MAAPAPSQIVPEPVVFAPAFEGFLRAFDHRLDAEAREAIRRIGINVDKMQPAYPVGQWAQLIDLVARKAFPTMSREDAHFHCGREFIDGFTQTMIGKALFAFGKVVGIKRMVGRVTTSMKTSVNYIDTRVENLPDGAILESWVLPAMLDQVHAQPETTPHYFLGILHQASSLVAGDRVRVELLSYDPVSTLARYRVWIS